MTDAFSLAFYSVVTKPLKRVLTLEEDGLAMIVGAGKRKGAVSTWKVRVQPECARRQWWGPAATAGKRAHVG